MNEDAQAIFAGNFERSMDAKKRVPVPAAWLQGKDGGEVFYSVPHPAGGFLMVMTPEVLKQQEQHFMENPRLSPIQKREAVRMFYASAFRLTTDGQGRILLPDEHCEQAGLKGPVVFVGAMSRFEIWDKEKYAAERKKAQESYLLAAMESGL